MNMKSKYSGTLPLNARISIDFDKEKVNFSYPRNVKRPMLTKFVEAFNFNAKIQVYHCFAATIPFLFFHLYLQVIGYGWIANAILSSTLLIGLIITSLSVIIQTVVLFNIKSFSLFFPKANARFMNPRVYEATFKKINSNTVEIPLFKNVFLDYEATRDYGKYLIKIDIIEHPFVMTCMKTKKKGKPNEYLWKAIFTFSQIPKAGKLVVKFI